MQKYALFHKYNDIDELYTKITDFIEDENLASLNIYCSKVDSLWKAFRSYFENRVAAGGLILRDNQEILLIKRYGKWDIPKGHLKARESVADCARREIEEETGLVPGKKLDVLKPSYHIYRTDEAWVLKQTHWYIFSYPGAGSICPQVSEGISEVRWFSRKDIGQVYKNTWLSINDVITEALNKLWND